MTSQRHPGSLLQDLDLDRSQFLDLVTLAGQLKEDKARGTETPRLGGAGIALVFEKNSTRTRCAFEVAAHDQGAHVTYLGPDGSHIGRDESIADTARVLGRMYDGIAFRGYSQATVETLAEHAGVPVWNALTDAWHPTQALADVLTMTQHHGGDVKDIAFCFTGDGRNNVARSLLVTGALLGMDVRVAAPADRRPPQEVVTAAENAARSSGARVMVTDDVDAAVRGADFVYTDVWVSIGEPEETWATRIQSLLPYRVTERLLDAAGRPGVRFMHCLPSIHNRDTAVGDRLYDRFGLDCAEVTEEVFESKRSIVFDQAENRLHTIKALLVRTLAG
ncbi:ornithine carbamoyltransferase [Streptosporangium lutulentum]|uniref:Ornithine carbamoyltransferase n=1 Tax=Streptosporangium lutulentum TaxID=1461250 RepID=A0ABT9QGQ1_9ACTN|nr:ornithine carbamoyltransferase [Streptosporangium lutulentum]MDP9845541.1 ornithine carbamoyltransferase [Streptosporangium lutulentum]